MTQNAIVYHNAMPCSIGVLEVCTPSGDLQLFVPLRESNLTGTITGPHASCTLTHTFSFSCASFNETIEAVYRFPLPGTSIITGCTAEWPDETMQAEFQDSDEAADVYHHAFFEARRGLFLKKETDSICTLHVTGINPDCPVRVRISFTFKGDGNACSTTFAYPLTFTPGEAGEFSLLTLPDPGHRFSLSLEKADAGHITGTSHQTTVVNAPSGQRITFLEKNVIPDRILLFRSETPPEGPGDPGSRQLGPSLRYADTSHETAYVCTGKARYQPVKATIAIPSASFIVSYAETGRQLWFYQWVVISRPTLEQNLKFLKK